MLVTLHIFQYRVYVNELTGFNGIYQLSYANKTNNTNLIVSVGMVALID